MGKLDLTIDKKEQLKKIYKYTYNNSMREYRMNSIDFEERRKSKSGNTSDLSKKQILKVKNYLYDNIVSDAKEIQKYIEKIFDIKYSLSGTTVLLHHLNFVYKKSHYDSPKGE